MTVVAGDFFSDVPAGADAYLLRKILHDWHDADCVRILHAVRRAVTQRSRLLIVDAVVGPPNEDPQSKFLDLMMLVTAGGRARTANVRPRRMVVIPAAHFGSSQSQRRTRAR